MKLTSADVARFPRPGMAIPGKLAFSPDGRLLTFLWSPRGDLARDLVGLDLATGNRTVLHAGRTDGAISADEVLRRERQRLRELGVTHYAWAESAPVLLVPMAGVAHVDGRAVATGVTDPQLSPDGRRLAFVRAGDLWAVDLDGPKAGAERQLTRGAEPPDLTHGLPDYLAQEEMHRHTGFWWSHDGRWLAFEAADARGIPQYPIVHQGAEKLAIETHRYPFAGGPNPKVRLGVVPADGGPVRWMELGAAEYLCRVTWMPDGRLFVQTQPRDQRRLDLVSCDPATGAATPVLTETSASWVNLHDDLRPLEGGGFLWASERSGTKQLYVYRGGGAPSTLTAAAWPVDVVLRGTPTHVVFAGAGLDPVQRHVWRVPLAGGAVERLTPDPGWHDAVVSRDGTRLALTRESGARPPGIEVVDIGGRGSRTVHAPAAAPDLPRPERLAIRARDGTALHGLLYRPMRVPAPLLVYVYGGPHVQLVQDTWANTVDLRAQWLAQQGFAVLKVDGRGSARRGVAFESAIARRMGDLEVQDQVDGVRHVQAMGVVAGDRVGVYGWSYGGYLTLMCLARAPEVFRAGVSGAPVVHWEDYDTHYTERYMGTPRENPEGYRQGAVTTHVDAIRAPLLVIHGLLDENVLFRHTARLLDTLARRGIPHESMILTGERHMPREPAMLAAMEERILRFFTVHLGASGAGAP